MGRTLWLDRDLAARMQPAARVDGILGPEENLRRDEELLSAGAPAVRVAILSEAAVSFGVAQGADPVGAAAARATGVAVVRRRTGGSGLLHLPGDVVWAVVLPRAHPAVGADFPRAYGRLGHGLVRFFADAGLPASWEPAPGVAPAYCLLSPRGQVLTGRGRIFGGAAQHATARALLHHGVLASRQDPVLLERLFGVPPELTRSRLAGLDELLGRSLGAPELASLAGRIAEALATEPARPG